MFLLYQQPEALTPEGPNVFDISSETPEGCTVDQAVYISRHGSRYPDPGAYNGWLELYDKVRSLMPTARPAWLTAIDPRGRLHCQRRPRVLARLATCGRLSGAAAGAALAGWIR